MLSENHIDPFIQEEWKKLFSRKKICVLAWVMVVVLLFVAPRVRRNLTAARRLEETRYLTTVSRTLVEALRKKLEIISNENLRKYLRSSDENGKCFHFIKLFIENFCICEYSTIVIKFWLFEASYRIFHEFSTDFTLLRSLFSVNETWTMVNFYSFPQRKFR